MRLLLITLLLTTLLSSGTIRIAVAANVSYAMKDLKKEFNTLYPHIKIQVALGSTGKLTAQIKNKAPYDILMGANMYYPNTLYKEGFAITLPHIYAQGSLALITTRGYDMSQGIDSLSNAKIKKIAIANPKTAPYGIATLEALKNAKLYQANKSKLVYGESISQTVTYAMKATDFGFIAKSALYSPQMSHLKKDRHWVEINSKLYTPIDQGIVILKRAKANQEVKAFYDFIRSPQAKVIFEKFGYLVP